MRGIELRAALGGDGIDDGRLVIGLVVPHEVRPTVIPRAAGLIDLVVPAWPASRRVRVRVRANLAPVDETSVLIHGNPIRVAMAHRIDLGSRLCRAFGKKVPVGGSVGAVGLRM